MNGLQWILKNQERLKIRIVNISIGTNDRHAYPEDSAIRAVKLIADVMANAIIEGRQGESFEAEEVAEEVSEEPASMEEVVAGSEEE